MHPDALSAATLALIASDWTPKGLWLTLTPYVIGDIVEESGKSYVCAVAHTAGTFATDHAAGKWVILGQTSTIAASNVSFTPAGNIAATTVQAAIEELDGEKAALAGSTGQAFSVGAATVSTQALRRAQAQDGSMLHVVGGGTGDAITGTLATGGVVTLTDGMRISVRAPAANSAAAPTFNLTLDATATGALDIVRGDTLGALVAGDIAGAGHELDLKLKTGSPNKWLLLNPRNPSNVTTTAIQTLTNKTLTSPAISQIVFPATQVPSSDPNTLDDYEEGTWTPSLGGTATYSVQYGAYVKIGKLVYVIADVIVNTIGTGSTTSISGLPYTVRASPAGATFAVGELDSAATAVVSVTAKANTGSTTIDIASRTAASTSDGTNAIFGNNTFILVSGSYLTD